MPWVFKKKSLDMEGAGGKREKKLTFKNLEEGKGQGKCYN